MELQNGVKWLNLSKGTIHLPFCFAGCFEKEEENNSWTYDSGTVESIYFSLSKPLKGSETGRLAAQQKEGPGFFDFLDILVKFEKLILFWISKSIWCWENLNQSPQRAAAAITCFLNNKESHSEGEEEQVLIFCSSPNVIQKEDISELRAPNMFNPFPSFLEADIDIKVRLLFHVLVTFNGC